jgi:hypothetical protein
MTQSAKKISQAPSRLRIARIVVTAPPANTADPSPIKTHLSDSAGPPAAGAFPSTTSTTPSDVSISANSVRTLKGSRRNSHEKTATNSGELLLSSVATPTGRCEIAMKYSSTPLPPSVPRSSSAHGL